MNSVENDYKLNRQQVELDINDNESNITLEKMKEKAKLLKLENLDFNEDKDIVKAAQINNISPFEFVEKILKNDKKLIKESIVNTDLANIYSEMIKYRNFEEEPEFLKELISDCGLRFVNLSNNLKNDKKLIKFALMNDPNYRSSWSSWHFIDPKFKQDKQFLNELSEEFKIKENYKYISLDTNKNLIKNHFNDEQKKTVDKTYTMLNKLIQLSEYKYIHKNIDPGSSHILNSKGIEKLAKKFIPNLNEDFCLFSGQELTDSGYTEFLKKLESISLNIDDTYAYMVRSTNQHAHTTPILINIENEKATIVVIDSLGKYSSFAETIKKSIEDNSFLKDSKDYKFIFTTQQIQSDSINCSVFGIKIIIEAKKIWGLFFEEMENVSITDNDYPDCIRIVNLLPPEFVAFIQSTSSLEEYITSLSSKMIFCEQEKRLKKMNERIVKHMVKDNKDKPIFQKITHTSMKYWTYLITDNNEII